MKVLNDLLWDGDLKIYQNEDGFKFSLDSVLLANFVTINKSVKKIMDIGTGNAPIPLMLTKRTNAKITGIEIQKCSYELAIESVKYNNLCNQIEIINGDINEIYKKFDNNSYDVIVCNPPYYKDNMKLSDNNHKKMARSESTFNLNSLFLISKRLLKSDGKLAIVIDSKRLVEVIELMKSNQLEAKKIQFVFPKISKESNIVLIECTKNGREGIKVLEPIIVQNVDNTYTNYIEKILKDFGKY